MKFIDLTGNKFGKIYIKSIYGKRGRYYSWNAICDCGKEFVVDGLSAKSGNTNSCGCIHKEMLINRSSTHLKSKTSTYYSWANMIQRCTNTKLKQYKDYGGRGITVCDRWLHSFENFLEDMGEKQIDTTIERNSNNDSYCKENCRWATIKEQQNNKRNNHIITYNGESLTVSQWSEKIGVNYNTLLNRINTYKWTIERSLTTSTFK